MKKLKKGFSLAELLIAMGIIAVIATMGFSISKKGVENAYNLYFYTGYKGLYDAITETNSEEIDLINITQGPVGIFINRTLNDDFIDNMAKLLKVDNVVTLENGHKSLTAPNGINYEIWFPNLNTFNSTANPGIGYPYIDIIMTVPQVRRNGVLNQTEFIYVPQYEGGMLIPITRNDNTLDLQNRKDLIPFYGENGINGKVIIPDGSNQPNNFQRRRFYSFREAYCKKYDNHPAFITSGHLVTVINCDDVVDDGFPFEGFIQAENPKKVF